MIRRYLITAIFVIFSIIIAGWLFISPGGINNAPEVTFRITDGRQVSLRQLKGQPVLVTFWATTCKTCISEMPHLIELYTDFSGKGLEIIGVAMSYDPPNQVVDMIKARNIPYPVSLDLDGKIAGSFDDVSFTPVSFLIAPNGVIVKHQVGEMDFTALRQQIKNLLSQQS